MYIISKLNKSVNQKGSSLLLPAHPSSTAKLTTGQAGGLGQGQRLFFRRFLRSKKRNSAAEKRGRAKIPSPKLPSFLPARAKIIKIQRPGFRGKKFGFCSG